MTDNFASSPFAPPNLGGNLVSQLRPRSAKRILSTAVLDCSNCPGDRNGRMAPREKWPQSSLTATGAGQPFGRYATSSLWVHVPPIVTSPA